MEFKRKVNWSSLWTKGNSRINSQVNSPPGSRKARNLLRLELESQQPLRSADGEESIDTGKRGPTDIGLAQGPSGRKPRCSASKTSL